MSRVKVGMDLSFWVEEDYSLRCAVAAEEAGFDTVWFGDHFLPWHHAFKQSFFAWSVIQAAAERTRRVEVGVDVTVPIGGRYHPAIVAHAFATLDRLYPGRILLGVGNGEAMNEKRFMGFWPSWRERTERLCEAIELMNRLFTEEDFFDFQGRYFQMSMVYLYVKPTRKIPIYYSAIGPKAAYYAGRYGDHLLTWATVKDFKEKILPNFERGAREAGKDPSRMERVVLLGGSVGDVEGAVRWIRRVIAGAAITELFNEPDPRVIERRAQQMSDEEIKNIYRLFPSPEGMVEEAKRFIEAGANHIVFTDFTPDFQAMMRAYREVVIPELKAL